MHGSTAGGFDALTTAAFRESAMEHGTHATHRTASSLGASRPRYCRCSRPAAAARAPPARRSLSGLDGLAWLIVRSDSGFEGRAELCYTRIEAELEPR